MKQLTRIILVAIEGFKVLAFTQTDLDFANLCLRSANNQKEFSKN